METINLFLHPYIFVGPEGALVEGVKKILCWDTECIEMLAGKRIIITGKRLRIEYKSSDALLVKGNICQIVFSGDKRK